MPDHVVKLFWTSQRHRNEATVCKFDICETYICCQHLMFSCSSQVPGVLQDLKKQIDEIAWGPLGLFPSGHLEAETLDLKKIQSKVLASYNTMMGLRPS